jgi:hypothetical protein
MSNEVTYPKPNSIVSEEIWIVEFHLATMLELYFSSRSQKPIILSTRLFFSQEYTSHPWCIFNCSVFLRKTDYILSLPLKQIGAFPIVISKGLMLFISVFFESCGASLFLFSLFNLLSKRLFVTLKQRDQSVSRKVVF